MLAFSLALTALVPLALAADPPHNIAIPADRVASIGISQDFLNEQIRAHLKPGGVVREANVTFEVEHDEIVLHGLAQVPIEELRAVNLEPNMGKFRFQVAIELKVSKKGHLVLDFPMHQTYFWPAESKNSEQDRVEVPVQMLAIALASARGYLAALSGDFGGFDRQTKKLEAQARALDHSIKHETDKDVLDDLKTQREALRLQLEAIPIERKQLQGLAKEFAAVLAFTGEKELNLNDELVAKRNALLVKLNLSQLTPYLAGTELGGVRLRHDAKDGNGENYFLVDVNADLEEAGRAPSATPPANRPPMKTAPALVMRLNQALFESKSLVTAEKTELDDSITNFRLDMEDDGIHVSGNKKMFWFIHPSFNATVDFNFVEPDVFDVSLADAQVAGFSLAPFTKMVLENVKRRLNHALKGMLHSKYVETAEHRQALRVTVDPKALVPAFPGLHLVGVDVRTRMFLLKVGHVDGATAAR